MGLNLSHGGHLTHGSPYNVSGKWFKVIHYGVNEETGLIDYDNLETLALKYKPKMIISGGSAYSRIWEWDKISSIAKKIGAYHVADIAHYAGLIATDLYPSPINYADVVTTTTHKTLRGPRGGLILTNIKELAKCINAAVFPGEQGGPLMHVIAAKSVALGEVMQPSFKLYQKQVLVNAKTLAKTIESSGLTIVSGGTDSHMFLVDLRPINIKGKEAQDSLECAGITLNKNTIPYDPEKASITSGIRIGSAAVTTRGMKELEMIQISKAIVNILQNINNTNIIHKVKEEMLDLCYRFPLYEHLNY
jgi:glycine hydroxymethyltransferase